MQGLRVIKTVIDIKGQKRFKNLPQSQAKMDVTKIDSLDLNLQSMDSAAQMERFVKKNF